MKTQVPVLPLVMVFLATFLSAHGSPAVEAPVVLHLELRGLENGALYVGDPIRLLVGVTPGPGRDSGRISVPDSLAWTSALRVRIHREDGRSLGDPAKPVDQTLPAEVEFTQASPAMGIWRWSQALTADLPPGTYRVSARLLTPRRDTHEKHPPLAVAETSFRLLAAPGQMDDAQRGRWHHLLAMDAFLSGDLERAKKLNASSLSLRYANPEAQRLKVALEAGPRAAAHAPVTAASTPPPEPPAPTSTPVPTEAPRDAVQWASAATASSQYDVKKWSAMQATGAPNVTSYGDRPDGWAPKLADGGEEWLELTYDPAVTNPAELRVHQNFNPGSLSRVEVTLSDGTILDLWTGTDRTAYAPNQVGVFKLQLPDKLGPVAKVKLTFDTKRTKGWEEVDAVSLSP
ncbi:MAG: hypothetical protein SFV32_12010 [Opitutaceae bacterium]|nr:hypothetical protein [Opitutaceae bacterium]